eukprot:1194365-Prorocentrum_minimum.AAC.5
MGPGGERGSYSTPAAGRAPRGVACTIVTHVQRKTHARRVADRCINKRCMVGGSDICLFRDGHITCIKFSGVEERAQGRARGKFS